MAGRCQSEPFATQVRTESCSLFDSKLCKLTLWWQFMSCTYVQVQMSKWAFCHTSHNRILFALWCKTILQTVFLVIIHSSYFQVQMSKWTFCHTSHNRILLALWFKTILQTDFVVIIHSFYFQVQMSNWTFCYTSHNRILFALWFKTLQTNNVGIIYVLYILSSSFWNFPPPTQSPSVDLF